MLDGEGEHRIPLRLREREVADRGIYEGTLGEVPLVEKLLDVIEDEECRADDLSRPWVDPRGGVGILSLIGDIADAGVLQIVRIKAGGGVGEIPYLDGVLKSDLLEGLIPRQDTVADRLLPLLGECGIEIEDDRLLGLRESAGGVGGGVCRLESPSVGDVDVVGLVLEGGEIEPPGGEGPDAGVGDAYRHRLLRQSEQGKSRLDRRRHIARHGDHAEEGGGELIIELHTHLCIVFVGLHTLDEGEGGDR